MWWPFKLLLSLAGWKARKPKPMPQTVPPPFVGGRDRDRLATWRRMVLEGDNWLDQQVQTAIDIIEEERRETHRFTAESPDPEGVARAIEGGRAEVTGDVIDRIRPAPAPWGLPPKRLGVGVGPDNVARNLGPPVPLNTADMCVDVRETNNPGNQGELTVRVGMCTLQELTLFWRKQRRRVRLDAANRWGLVGSYAPHKYRCYGCRTEFEGKGHTRAARAHFCPWEYRFRNFTGRYPLGWGEANCQSAGPFPRPEERQEEGELMEILDSMWWTPMPPMAYVGAVAVTFDGETFCAFIGTYMSLEAESEMPEETAQRIGRRGARLTEDHARALFPAIQSPYRMPD